MDDLRKQYEVLKEKFQKLSETLLSEVEYFRENITTELARFVQTVYENNEKSLNEVIWWKWRDWSKKIFLGFTTLVNRNPIHIILKEKFKEKELVDKKIKYFCFDGFW